MRIFQQLRQKLSFIMGADVLSGDFYKFLRMHLCFTVYTQMHGIFINTFLLKATGNNVDVMLFNAMLAIAQPIAMVGAVYLSRRTSPVLSQRLGLGLYLLVYGALAIFGEQAVGYSLLIAALLASAAGFYYTTYSLQILSYCDDRSRDVALGVSGMLAGIAALLTPVFSGFLISSFPGFTGYRVLFGCALAFTALSGYFSSRLSPITAYDGQRGNRLGQVVRALLLGKIERGVMLTSAVSGFRDGTMAFFLNMLLYQFVQSEALVGINSFLGGIAAVISAGLYSRWVKPESRVKSVAIAVSIIAATALMLFLRLNAYTIIAFNLVSCLCNIFVSNPPCSLYLSIVQRLPSIRGRGGEVHTIREYFLSTGRILGIALAMLLPQSNLGYILVIFLLTVSQYASAALMRRTRRQLAALPEEPAEVSC